MRNGNEKRKNQVLSIGIAYVGILLLTYFLYLLLKLNLYSSLAIFLILGGLFWLHRRAYEKQCLQSRHFYDACIYMETILYAFGKSEKIEAALEDSVTALKEGRLKETLQEALNHIALTFEESDILKGALSTIESAYPCKRIHTIHEFMLHAEYYGGEINQAIHLLLEDKKRWQNRMEKTITERKKSFREVILSVAVSLIICGVILYLPALNNSFSAKWPAQVAAVLLVCLDDLIILRAQHFLNVDWLNLDSFRKDGNQMTRLEEFRRGPGRKSRMLSYILGGSTALISLALLCFGKKWLACGGMLLAFLLFNQHKVGHWLMKRNLKKEIASAFPNWLLDLALLLQSENVQMALSKSREQAPEILYSDLDLLVDRLVITPESSEPYHEFLKEFEMPEIHAAMSKLYAISSGRKESSQLGDLIENNYQLLDEAERIRLKDKGSGLYLLFLAPVLTASCKLVLDMAMFMISFMGSGFSL